MKLPLPFMRLFELVCITQNDCLHSVKVLSLSAVHDFIPFILYLI